MKEMILISIFFAASAAMSAGAGTVFSRRIETAKGGVSNHAPNGATENVPAESPPGASKIAAARAVGSLGAFALFTALCYLSIYHIHIHYLVIFKL